MKEKDFSELLSRMESKDLDFKMTQYDFTGSEDEKNVKRVKFVKDIICLANTPRGDAAYIVLGVKCCQDGKKDLIGITQHFDDAVFQDKVSGWIHPHPRFSYQPVPYKGKTFGLITIPADKDQGPYYCVRDGLGDILQRHRVYFRRSSQNSIATQDETKVIYEWFSEAKKHGSFMPAKLDIRTPWDTFVQAVDYFDERRTYILVLSPLTKDLTANDYEAFGGIGWYFVADFDPCSYASGVFAESKKIIESKRAIHILTKSDEISFSPRNATYWYFARGIDERKESLVEGGWREWHKLYARDILEKVSRLSKAAPRPITIIAAWYDLELLDHFNTFVETVIPQLGDGVEVVIVTDERGCFEKMASRFGSELVEIPVNHLIEGIRELTATQKSGMSDDILIPSSSGAPVKIDKKLVAWLEEDLEIVHRNLGLKPPAGTIANNEFLRGCPISWFDLAINVDIERELQAKLKRNLERILQNRRTGRVNLYHEPGAGGSTLARRIVWDLRDIYPCVLLHRCEPKQTIERLQRLYTLSNNPLLVLTEGHSLTEQQSDELETLLKSRNIPAILFQVLRRFEKPRRLAENAFHLESILTPVELQRFENQLRLYVPERSNEIHKAIIADRESEKTPFYLGLIAFEHNFVSLNNHIKHHIEQMNNDQKKAFIFLSIAYHYGQMSLDAQMFSKLFGLSPTKPVDINKMFNEYTLRLLVRVDANNWRPAHQLIAKEFVEQALSSGLDDRRGWRTRLSDEAIDFAEYCAECDGSGWDRLNEILQRVFIFREEHELRGTDQASFKFSRIVTDIPSEAGKLRLFSRLTQLFPDNNHFWAHLGRYYADTKEYDKAIEAIDKALSLSEGDHVIHHIKGMAYRNWMYDNIKRSEPLEVIIQLAKNAASSFKEARRISPDSDYGYISEIQLIAKALDYGASTKNQNAVLVAINHQDEWFRECFDIAENLLEDVKRIRKSEGENEYEARCRADLDKLYGNHSDALQRLQNIVDKRKVYLPPIRRQIINTMLYKSGRSWKNMKENEIERCLQLSEINIVEEPNNWWNIRNWMQAIRVSNRERSFEDIIEKVGNWATMTETLDAYYYLYILYSINAIEGSNLAIERSESALEKCKLRAKYRRDRTKSYEWLGHGKGLKRLVHQEDIGKWDEQKNFWENTKALFKQEGIIINIRGPEAGNIEVAGLKAFFVPGVSKHAKGEAENKKVKLFLGFSYDGLRAWAVEDA